MMIARRLARLPPDGTRLLDIINARTTHRPWYRRAPLADVQYATQTTEPELGRLLQVVEAARFRQRRYGPLDETGPPIDVHGSEMGSWGLLLDFRRFCQAQGMILSAALIVNLRFELLEGLADAKAS
jgi:hypothetical protein